MLTNLPFVFALWAVRPGFNEVKQIDALTQRAAEMGASCILRWRLDMQKN